MAGPRLEIEARGEDVAARHLREMGGRAADARPAFEEIEEELRARQTQWFSSKGAGRWPALTDETIVIKQAAGQRSMAVLVATGALRDSLTERGGADALREVHRDELRFGTEVPYARFHRFGTGQMPKRDPLAPLDARIRRQITKTIGGHVAKGGRRWR